MPKYQDLKKTRKFGGRVLKLQLKTSSVQQAKQLHKKLKADKKSPTIVHEKNAKKPYYKVYSK